jgi:hypothetical protein
MNTKLLENYINMILFESKLTPRNDGITSGKSGFSKNVQTPGIAGGNVNVKLKDQRIQSPDDHFYYQYMQVDGPDQDTYTGKTFAVCKIDKKFSDLFPKNLMNYKITASGPNADADVENEIKKFYLKVKTVIDSNLDKSQNEKNIYTLNKSKSASW